VLSLDGRSGTAHASTENTGAAPQRQGAAALAAAAAQVSCSLAKRGAGDGSGGGEGKEAYGVPTRGKCSGIVYSVAKSMPAYCEGFSGGIVARLATGSSWRSRPQPGEPEKRKGCQSTVIVEAWSLETLGEHGSHVFGSQGPTCGEKSLLSHSEKRPGGQHVAAQVATEMAPDTFNKALLPTPGAQAALRSSGVRSETAVAAAEDAAAITSGRGGRGGGRGDGSGGRGGRGGRADGRGGCGRGRSTGGYKGHGSDAPAEGQEAAAKRAQAKRKAEAASAEEEQWLREARQRADLAVARALAAAPSPTAAERVRQMELAGRGAAAVRVQAAVRGAAVQRQWRHVLVTEWRGKTTNG
jgi:hypothetical protein